MANLDMEAPRATILRRRQAFGVGLDRALHDAPLAHAVLVDAALVVDRVERPVEHRVELHRVRRRDLRHPRRRHELDVEPLVLEKALVARDQHRQVVHRVHDGDFRFAFRRLPALRSWVFSRFAGHGGDVEGLKPLGYSGKTL